MSIKSIKFNNAQEKYYRKRNDIEIIIIEPHKTKTDTQY